jgi:hypothetical protein
MKIGEYFDNVKMGGLEQATRRTQGFSMSARAGRYGSVEEERAMAQRVKPPGGLHQRRPIAERSFRSAQGSWESSAFSGRSAPRRTITVAARSQSRLDSTENRREAGVNDEGYE